MLRAFMTRFVLAALLLAGCKKPAPPTPDQSWLEGRLVQEQAAPRDGGEVVIRLALEPVGLTRLHDRFAEGTMARITVGPVYETLGGRLATGWARNGSSLTVELRPGVFFHDGRPFTSHDVAATIEAVRAPGHATATFREALSTLGDVETPGPYTVVLHFVRPYVFAEHAALYALPILPAHALEGEWDTLPLHHAPIGTGPFRFEKWERGSSLSYVKADARAKVNRVTFRFVKDETAANTAWERGEFDVMTRISPSTWRAMEKEAWAINGYQRLAVEERAYVWAGFNQRQKKFADVKTREALALLFPAAVEAKTVMLGLSQRNTCPYFEPRSCDENVRAPEENAQRAAKLLDEAGWELRDGVRTRDGEKFEFSFLLAAQSTRMGKTLPLYVEALKGAGINARIETVDVSAYMSRVRAHDFDAITLSWASPDGAHDNFQNFHSSQRDDGNNFVSFSDAETDQLLEDIRVTYDEGKRQALERQLHARVAGQHAYLFLGRTYELFAFKRRVHGVAFKRGALDLASLWVDE